jgi:arthrofactin-type cyclic lipopeptide synthetase C
MTLWRADGVIEYLGRNDCQVKIGGVRIELGEIESRLCMHPGVKEGVVVLREDEPGDKRLLAYYTETKKGSVKLDELRTFIRAALPEYMIPGAFVALDHLPLTLNGKLDRSALPKALEASLLDKYIAPKTSTEATLVGVWSELLRVDRTSVSVTSNFFSLGGNSLLLIRLLQAVRSKFGVDLNIRQTLADYSLSEIAASIDALSARTRQAHELAALPPTEVEQVEFGA